MGIRRLRRAIWANLAPQLGQVPGVDFLRVRVTTSWTADWCICCTLAPDKIPYHDSSNRCQFCPIQTLVVSQLSPSTTTLPSRKTWGRFAIDSPNLRKAWSLDGMSLPCLTTEPDSWIRTSVNVVSQTPFIDQPTVTAYSYLRVEVQNEQFNKRQLLANGWPAFKTHRSARSVITVRPEDSPGREARHKNSNMWRALPATPEARHDRQHLPIASSILRNTSGPAGPARPSPRPPSPERKLHQCCHRLPGISGLKPAHPVKLNLAA